MVPDCRRNHAIQNEKNRRKNNGLIVINFNYINNLTSVLASMVFYKVCCCTVKYFVSSKNFKKNRLK